MQCPVCDLQMEVQDTTNLSTAIHECRDCDLFYRPVNSSMLDTQFGNASYTQIENEGRFYEQRVEFFRLLLDRIEALLDVGGAGSEQPILLDFGCAYGHLMSLAADRGITPFGVERNADLRRHCTEKGLTVAPTLSALTDRQLSRIRLAAFIDSFYYIPRPRELLVELKEVLSPGTNVIVRLTNRNAGVRLRNRFSSRAGFNLLGDAVVSYSPRAARRLFDAAGFEVQELEPDTGRGKRLPSKKALLYAVTGLLSIFLPESAMLTPGFILYARVPIPD